MIANFLLSPASKPATCSNDSLDAANTCSALGLCFSSRSGEKHNPNDKHFSRVDVRTGLWRTGMMQRGTDLWSIKRGDLIRSEWKRISLPHKVMAKKMFITSRLKCRESLIIEPFCAALSNPRAGFLLFTIRCQPNYKYQNCQVSLIIIVRMWTLALRQHSSCSMLICLVGADWLRTVDRRTGRENVKLARSDLIEMKSCSADSSGGCDWAD